jgi:hypothetical protein
VYAGLSGALERRSKSLPTSLSSNCTLPRASVEMAKVSALALAIKSPAGTRDFGSLNEANHQPER